MEQTKQVSINTLTDKEVLFFSKIVEVDMTQEEKYSYIIPAGKTQSFKVTFLRQFPLDKYAKHEISIISAKDAKSIF